MANIEVTLQVGPELRKYKIGLELTPEGEPRIIAFPTVLAVGPKANGDPVSMVGSYMVHDYLMREVTKNPALAKILAEIPEV